MDIISDPALIEETVRDLDIGFVGSPVYSLTLHPTDTLYIAPGEPIEVQLASSGEVVTFYRTHMLWYSLRTRTIQKLAPVPPKS